MIPFWASTILTLDVLLDANKSVEFGDSFPYRSWTGSTQPPQRIWISKWAPLYPPTTLNYLTYRTKEEAEVESRPLQCVPDNRSTSPSEDSGMSQKEDNNQMHLASRTLSQNLTQSRLGQARRLPPLSPLRPPAQIVGRGQAGSQPSSSQIISGTFPPPPHLLCLGFASSVHHQIFVGPVLSH